MQAQMREAVYWPGIYANIANYVHQCTICTMHKASPPTQPMLPRDIPNGCGRRLLPITSPTRVKSTYWYAICLASTPFYIKYPPSMPSHCPCACKSSSLSVDQLVCFTLTMAFHLLSVSLCTLTTTSHGPHYLILPLPKV